MGNYLCCEEKDNNEPITSSLIVRKEYVSTPREVNPDDIISLANASSGKPFRQFHGLYAAKLYGITDGDTLHAIVMFMGQPRHVKIRVSGIDTPEKNTPETKIMGEKATEEVYKFFGAYGLLKEYQNEKNKRINEAARKSKEPACIRMSDSWYKKFSSANIIFTLDFQVSKNISDGDAKGRMLARVIVNGKDLSEHLIEKGLANRYYGGTKNQTNFVTVKF